MIYIAYSNCTAISWREQIAFWWWWSSSSSSSLCIGRPTS